jgi:hypothetical protein
MDTQGAIEQYRILAPKIFHQGPQRFLGANIAKSLLGKAWFSGEKLEEGVKAIVKSRLPQDEKERLRAPTAEFTEYTIWQAARATSAAPFYFPTAVIGRKRFWDGGLANNNPVQEVWAEAQGLFRARPANCIISLGTGFSERKPRRSLLPVLGRGKKILKNVTNTERPHLRVAEEAGNRGVPYYRFNPSTAQDQIGLADHKLLDALEEHTVNFLGGQEVQAEIRRCAELLAHVPRIERQSEATDTVPVAVNGVLMRAAEATGTDEATDTVSALVNGIMRVIE